MVTCKKLIIGTLAALMIFVNGCGDATRNDQGVTFSFLGWFSSASAGSAITGVATNLSSVGQESAASNGGVVTAFAGVQNNLLGQFIRVERVFHSYYIPGARIQPPSTSVSFSGLAGSAGANDNSTLPATSGGSAQLFGQVAILPASIREFITLNRNLMPEAPFVMIVTSYATGVTSSGKTMETNEVEIDVTFTPDLIVTPSGGGSAGGDGSSTGSGGSTDSGSGDTDSGDAGTDGADAGDAEA